MKELSIEQKAKAYDKALKYAKIWIGHYTKDVIAWLEKQGKETSWKPSKEEMDVLYGLAYITNQYDEHKEEVITCLYQELKREFFNGSSYENMFPNTEDGVRRRSTIQVLEYARNLDNYNQYGKSDIDKNIAWLEKQVPVSLSHDDEIMIRQLTEYFTTGKGLQNTNDTVVEWLADVKRKLEKQSEQKSDDKVEPKFHEGDWVVVSTTNGDKVVQIASVEYFKDGHPSYITTEGRWFDNGTKTRLLTDKDVETITIPESKIIINKVEPKFKVGDWITNGYDKIRIVAVEDYIYRYSDNYILGDIKSVDETYHLWTIQDAKDGDVICYKDEISLYKYDIKNCTKQETTFGGFVYHCCYDGKRLIINSLYSLTEQDKMDIHPATKEQHDLLFLKMKEVGYEWVPRRNN